MEEITYYIANDGKQFKDEWECQEYELSLLDTSTFRMYDGDGKKTDNVQNAWYVIIPNEKALNIFNQLYDYNCGSTLDNVGNYAWDDDYGEWDNLEDKIKDYQDKIDFLNKILKGDSES